MPALPTTPPFRTRVSPATKNTAKLAESKKVRLYSLGEGDAYRITVSYPFITSAQLSTLETFYDTNRDLDNTISASDGNSYNCWFESGFTVVNNGPTYFTASATLLAERI
tara:strand:+ start:7208 stop:7537 length:330 start_codon:yes stop_codon:yes gene_type:complete